MLKTIYTKLYKAYGPQGWWPIKGEYKQRKLSEQDKLEISIGAILTQNTSWRNVEKSIKQLHQRNLINLKKLAGIKEEKLSSLIKSSGYFRQKARKLKLFAKHVFENHGSLSKFLSQDSKKLREELLSLWGIGPETADSIILYAAQKPMFVIDAYTKRIMSRVGICKNEIDYHAMQNIFHKNLPRNHQLFNEYHALLVELAKRNCTKSKPACSTCPINKSCKKLIVSKDL